MEIVAAAEMAMTMKRAEFGQNLSTQMMKQSLQQDAAVLQVVAAATQPPAQASSPPPTSGRGQVLDITA
ncbi:MAG TPA: hypothetical protein VK196_14240 [Magnetospirillum sp.]|nr:hypothetical protein [Magnetospirillum sp.]